MVAKKALSLSHHDIYDPSTPICTFEGAVKWGLRTFQILSEEVEERRVVMTSVHGF